jgi:exosortase family protein XrtM
MKSASESPNSPHSQASKKRCSPLIQTGWFLAIFILLQTLWNVGLGTSMNRLVVDTLTVKTAVALINVTTPSIGATAAGRQIIAPGGGINIGEGCEGTAVLFLLIAAIVAFPATLRERLKGAVIGFTLVYALNQLRIIALFHAFRTDRPLFELLHHTIAPIAMIAVAALFYLFWTLRDAPHDAARTGI